MFPTAIGRWLACAIGAGLLASPAALAAAPHRVLPGETLWSISTANNLTPRTVAIYNGLPENAQLPVGTTIYAEGVAILRLRERLPNDADRQPRPVDAGRMLIR